MSREQQSSLETAASKCLVCTTVPGVSFAGECAADEALDITSERLCYCSTSCFNLSLPECLWKERNSACSRLTS